MLVSEGKHAINQVTPSGNKFVIIALKKFSYARIA